MSVTVKWASVVISWGQMSCSLWVLRPPLPCGLCGTKKKSCGQNHGVDTFLACWLLGAQGNLLNGRTLAMHTWASEKMTEKSMGRSKGNAMKGAQGGHKAAWTGLPSQHWGIISLSLQRKWWHRGWPLLGLVLPQMTAFLFFASTHILLWFLHTFWELIFLLYFVSTFFLSRI